LISIGLVEKKLRWLL